jgi:hypothetical protein
MPERRILRVATALLLAWIAVDLAAVDTCALHGGPARAPANERIAAPDGDGGPAHQHAVLHPDHSFCHGLSTGADNATALLDPLSIGQTVADSPSGHPLRIASALYHPPQLAA